MLRFSNMGNMLQRFKAWGTKYNQVAERSKDLQMMITATGARRRRACIALCKHYVGSRLLHSADLACVFSDEKTLPRVFPNCEPILWQRVIGWISWFEDGNDSCSFNWIKSQRAGRFKAYHRILYDLVELGIEQKKIWFATGEHARSKVQCEAEPNAISAVYHRVSPCDILRILCNPLNWSQKIRGRHFDIFFYIGKFWL